MKNETVKKEVHLHERITRKEVIGKYAYNPHWNFGGIVNEVNERGIVVDGKWYSTITGNSVWDSIVINGFKIYENENKSY